MPKGRMLNKKISNDEKVAQLSVKATLLYTWSIAYLDFEGRLNGNVWSLKSIVPNISEITPRNIPYLIKEMVEADLVIYYGSKDSKYLQFKGFRANQNLREGREAASDIPPPTPEELQHNSSSTPAKDKIREDKIREEKIRVPYGTILEDLNDLLKTSYKPTVEKTKAAILARWREGFILEDFKKVHRTMLADWGPDPKMCKYLRPETLYGTKFEGYLNRKPQEIPDKVRRQVEDKRFREALDRLNAEKKAALVKITKKIG